MSKITWKPGTMLAPVPPALISCGTVEKPNVMTAAWIGIVNSEPPMTYVSIRPSRTKAVRSSPGVPIPSVVPSAGAAR